MKKLTALCLAILSGFLLPLSLPNELFTWGNPALGLIAILPLYLSIRLSPGKGWAAFCMAIFGGMSHGISSYWLWFFHGFRYWTLGSTILAYIFVYSVLGLYIKKAMDEGVMVRPLLFAMIWTVFEWGKSNGFLGYPWGLLPYSWNTVIPIIQVSELTGIYGLSFAMAWIGAALGEYFCQLLSLPVPVPQGIALVRRKPLFMVFDRARWALFRDLPQKDAMVASLGHIALSGMLFAAIAAYGFMVMDRPRVADKEIHAVIVQQNQDVWGDGGSEMDSLRASIRMAWELIEKSNRPVDIVLFSESSLKRDYDDNKAFYRQYPSGMSLLQMLEKGNVWLLTGAPEVLDYEKFEATNSAILLSPAGEKTASYAKMHPVPFAEAIPFWENDKFRSFIQNTVGLDSGWVMGSERTIFQLPVQGGSMVRFAAPICFEDAFAYLCRRFVQDGAEVLLNLTNDAWSKTRSAEIQHFVVARFRAVELRRTLVRATNSGMSAVVHPDGRIHNDMPLFTETAELVEIPVYTSGQSPYLLLGDWFPFLLAFLLGLSSLIIVFGKESKYESY